MAFNRLDMARVASASTGAHAMWLYLTSDTIADVLAPGYFDGSFTDFRVDDVISLKYNLGYKYLSVTKSDKTGVDVVETDFGSTEINSVLVASELVSQSPTALDVPVPITFGAAQGGPSDPVQIDAAGLTTFNLAGIYRVRVVLSISRVTAPGEAFFFFRGLFNGVQVGNPVSCIMTDDEMTIPLEFTFTGSISAATTMTFEMVRDSAGNNDGGLDARTSSVGWGTSPSASLRIDKLG